MKLIYSVFVKPYKDETETPNSIWFHNEEIHSLYRSPNIIRKSKVIRACRQNGRRAFQNFNSRTFSKETVYKKYWKYLFSLENNKKEIFTE